jgi:outer membrane receptor protein involved in Fe transport
VCSLVVAIATALAWAPLVVAEEGVAPAQADGGAAPSPVDGGAAPAPADGGPIPDGGAPADAAPPPTPSAAPTTSPPAEGQAQGGPPILPKTFTGVWGRITDEKTGEGLIEAQVKVIDPPTVKRSAITNIDGYFKLRLPPGTYDLRVFYELYRPQRVAQVVVERGKAVEINVKLSAEMKVAVQELVIEAKKDRRATTVLLQDRKKAATVQDAISAQEIARSPDSGANEAVKRIPSATIRDGRYLYIRGLGGRYSLTLLNRTFLPSPEPDEPSAPLDLFPTALLANLSIVKSYDVGLPASFSGGAMLLETNSYPTSFEYKLSLKLEYNSESTFRAMSSYRGGSADFLGYDSGARALPRAVPSNVPAFNPPLSDAQTADIGRSFRNEWEVQPRTAIPNISFTAGVGGTRPLAGARKLGYLASLSYTHRDEVRGYEIAQTRLDGPNVVARERSRGAWGREVGVLGALLNLGLAAGDNDVDLFMLYSHSGEKDAISIAGFSDTNATDFRASRLRFVQRDLFYSQLRGTHKLPRRHHLEIQWQVNAAHTIRNEPDTRDLLYLVSEDGSARFFSQPSSGERLFLRMRETSGGGGLDFMVPWSRFKLRAGAMAQAWDRQFDGRRFRNFFVGADPAVAALPPSQIFAPERYGADIDFREQTLPVDAYKGQAVLGAGYLNGELNVPSALRVLAGLRYELFKQELRPGTPFATTPLQFDSVDRTDHNLAPAANVVYALNDRMNLRAGYSYTVARPRFRELAPFAYFDFERRRPISGNPRLETTQIQNVDIRWEWFLRNGGVVAASAFYKYFDKPIEQVIISVSDGAVSYENAAGGHLVGGELEARSDLAFIHRRAKPFWVGLNASLIWSRVALRPDRVGALTSQERPLQGQSPYVINASIGYSNERTGTDVALLYNVYGERILEVGFQGLPDVYERPFHRLDLTISQRLHQLVRLKIAASNLAYQRYRLEQGSVQVQAYQPGVSAFVQLEVAK